MICNFSFNFNIIYKYEWTLLYIVQNKDYVISSMYI
jgi:hypothetical protein